MQIQLTNARSDWQAGQIGEIFEVVFLTAEGGRPLYIADISRLGLPSQYGFVEFGDAVVSEPGPVPASPSYHAQIMVDGWLDQEFIAEADAARMVTEVTTAIELDRLYAVRSAEIRDLRAGIQAVVDRMELFAHDVSALRSAIDATFGDGL